MEASATRINKDSHEFDLLAEVEVVNERDGGLIDAWVPSDLILQTDVPVDQEHVTEITDSMQEQQAECGVRQGQLSPVLIAQMPGQEQFIIIDGFHRVASASKTAKPEVFATIKQVESWEEIVDLRIITANTHKAVAFSRIITWVEESWSMTEWSKKLSPLQAFSLSASKSKNPGKHLGVTSEEMEQIRAWTTEKCTKWRTSNSIVMQHLGIAKDASPKLIIEARPRKSGHELPYITPQHLGVIARELPGKPNYEFQEAAAQYVTENNLSKEQTKKVVEVFANAEDLKEGLARIEDETWKSALLSTSKRRGRKTATSLTQGNEDGYTVVSESYIADFVISEVALCRSSLENLVLKGQYKAVPTDFDDLRYVDYTDDTEPLPHTEEHAWPEAKIKEFKAHLDTVIPVISGKVGPRYKISFDETIALMSEAGQRLVCDMQSGALRFVDAIDGHLFNKLLLRTFDDLFKNGNPERLSDKERVLLGLNRGKNVSLDRGSFIDVMQRLDARQRKILTFSAAFGLPAFAIAQFTHANEDSVLIELAELSKKASDLAIATRS